MTAPAVVYLSGICLTPIFTPTRRPTRKRKLGSNGCSSRPRTERAHQLSRGLRGAEHARSETPHSSVTASSVNEPPLEREGTAPSVIAVRAFSRIFAVSSRSLLQIHTRRSMTRSTQRWRDRAVHGPSDKPDWCSNSGDSAHKAAGQRLAITSRPET